MAENRGSCLLPPDYLNTPEADKGVRKWWFGERDVGFQSSWLLSFLSRAPSSGQISAKCHREVWVPAHGFWNRSGNLLFSELPFMSKPLLSCASPASLCVGFFSASHCTGNWMACCLPSLWSISASDFVKLIPILPAAGVGRISLFLSPARSNWRIVVS